MIWIGITVIGSSYLMLALTTGQGYPPLKEQETKLSQLLTIVAGSGILGVLSDFYILVIPMHLVVRLRLPLGKKLGVCGIFLTGFL
jgi:hypothetical protein